MIAAAINLVRFVVGALVASVLYALATPLLYSSGEDVLAFMGWGAVVMVAGGFLGIYGPGFSLLKRRRAKKAHGSARLARSLDLLGKGVLGGSGLLLGRLGGQKVRLNAPGHVLTVAPTRTGKGVSAVIPNLLAWPGSVLVFDPKGENAAVTARRRRELGQSVHVLDPFGVTGEASAAANPLDAVRVGTPDALDDARMVASMLVVRSGGDDGAHWDDEAEAVLAGLVLWVADTAPEDARHLGTVRELLTLPADAFADLLRRMAEAGGQHARTAANITGKEDRERGNVMSTAKRHTHFLDSERLGATLGRSSFAWDGLRDGSLSVFVVLPPDRLSTYRGWVRVLIACALASITRHRGQPSHRALFLLDEFAALGHMQPILDAVGLVGGYGVHLWLFLQDLTQLRRIYGDGAGTFIANAAAVQAFGTADQETAKLLSDMTGESTTYGRSSDDLTPGLPGGTLQTTGRPVLTPDEVRRLGDRHQLLFLRGQRAAKARKVSYLDDREFRGLYDPNPMHG